jgi:hypothetical protein
MGDLESLRSLREAFERVGTSRPVTLSGEEKVDLVKLIDEWGRQVGCWDMLPERVYDLRNALHDDLQG